MGWWLVALGAAVAWTALGRGRGAPAGGPGGPAPRPAMPEAPGPVRDAGPREMRDPPPTWDLQDERVDESFPASDPPGTY